MTSLIDAIREYINNRESLKVAALGLTAIALVLIFILTQIASISWRSTEKPEEEEIVRIELPEPAIKVKLAQKPKSPVRQEALPPVVEMKQTASPETGREASAPSTTPSVDVSSLVQSFDTEQFLKSGSDIPRPVSRRPTERMSRSTTLTGPIRSSVSTNDLSFDVSRLPTAIPGGRRSAPGGFESSSIDVGGASNGLGSVSGISGGIASGAGRSRATRSTGGRTGTATITLPGNGDATTATIDLHDLIEWMKAHPGEIPALVGYEMGHQKGSDLSSAVEFQKQGRRFKLFLSVNEKELLLRICLIEAGNFTLLKDNGIKEASNFLTSGDVLLDGGAINSLISSRLAPEEKAAEFYNIFWSWWEEER